MTDQEVQRLEERFAKWDAQIQKMQQEVDRSEFRMGESYLHELEVLKKRRDEAKAKLAKLRRNEAESWERETLEKGLYDIFDDIGRRVTRVINRNHKH